MFIRKNQPLAPPEPIFYPREKVVNETNESGEIETHVYFDTIDVCDPSNFPELPTTEEYSLSNLIKSGNAEALQQIPISGIISSDNEDLQNVNLIVEQLNSSK